MTPLQGYLLRGAYETAMWDAWREAWREAWRAAKRAEQLAKKSSLRRRPARVH